MSLMVKAGQGLMLKSLDFCEKKGTVEKERVCGVPCLIMRLGGIIGCRRDAEGAEPCILYILVVPSR